INSGFRVDIQQQADKVSETRVSFVPNEEGRLVLDLGGQGLPLVFDFEEEIDPSMIFVGHGRVSPPSAHFSLAMQDRHAMAWSDYDHDGRKDVFIDRGALGGRLRAYPEKIIRGIHDELLVSGGDERYTDISTEVGFDKNGCSGRHARWVDFDGDGRLDLFINCYNRHNVMTIGDYPKQLYHRGEDGRFRDVATEMGLGVPHIQFGSLEFVDLDHDGDQDYVAVTDDGVVVFKNNDGHFFNKEVLFRREKVGDVKVGDTTGDRWLFDGKLTVADYESDGDLDFFVASKRGNVLLRNEGDSFDTVALEPHGLPASSMTGNWVDYDNDGRMDLHLVPQGLYRQQADGSFEETGLLAFPEGKYRAAIGNWADLDNDGHMDVLLALSRDPDYTSWLDLLGKKKERPYWELKAYLNTNRENHWLEIELAGPPGNPEGIGARITVSTPSGQQTRQVGATDGAFFSQGNYRLHFGLGNHDRVDVMKVEWPGGKVEIRKDLKADQFLRLNHG
ncbi:MAG TPA: CRTAC1 family protein, partial [Chromatiaceae bacterium]|nr:CRTAC1 family protein [Chromatiaceae bacterium]